MEGLPECFGNSLAVVVFRTGSLDTPEACAASLTTKWLLLVDFSSSDQMNTGQQAYHTNIHSDCMCNLLGPARSQPARCLPCA